MYTRPFTPDFITSLKPNEIFVFGSNLHGMHGGGAARIALEKFGAIWGQGVGLQGQSYAIPTMQGGVETIEPYMKEFIAFAKAHPEYTFLVAHRLRYSRVHAPRDSSLVLPRDGCGEYHPAGGVRRDSQ